MKLALVSDIHANLEALRATLADIDTHAVDRIICLGDIVGYNANPSECIALLRRSDTIFVAGDHDLAASGRITTKTFNSAAARAIAWTRERLSKDELRFLAGLPLKARIANRILAAHGALHPEADCATLPLDSDERRIQSLHALAADPSGARIGLFGHTRQAGVFAFRHDALTAHSQPQIDLRDDAYYLINPGAVGQPRGADSRASYMLLDLERRTIALRRVAYDISVPFAATREAGLAPALSFVSTAFRSAFGKSLNPLRAGAPMRKIAASLGL